MMTSLPRRTTILSFCLLLAPAMVVEAGGLKSVLKGLGKLVGGAIRLASGKSSEPRVAGMVAPGSLGPVQWPSDWQALEGASQACFYVLGGVDRLLLRTPGGGRLRVPVPSPSTRRGSRLGLVLAPGDYAWVGYEWEIAYSHTLEKEKKTTSYTTTCIWREEAAFELPFTVLPGKTVFGGTLQVEVLSTQGGGASGLAQDIHRLMPPGTSVSRASNSGDSTLFGQEARQVLGVEVSYVDSPGAARRWLPRDHETQDLGSYLELERYLRWLERLAAQPHPANWPLDPFLGTGGTFRRGLYASWMAWVERQPARKRRRLSMGDWLREAGNQDAASLLEKRAAKDRIRALFSARQARIEARQEALREEQRAQQWGKRDP